MTNTLTVKHGSLALNIPYSVFVKGTSEFNDKADEYFSMLRKRYPWLSENSIAVLKRTTAEEMQNIIEESLRGPKKARMLSGEGKHIEAIKHLESYLIDFPDDGDAWYALGEILCKIGRTDEGYKAMNHGRRMF
ncbi:MAG: tetratricopeptide repeat protein [Methanomassiliicoccaceae archaeon]|jgi:tetratricopeptide (TPR) repeat protein|nr:tetratricopeptide repeat protein [Methanomassiliicoccaceae archaeon]